LWEKRRIVGHLDYLDVQPQERLIQFNAPDIKMMCYGANGRRFLYLAYSGAKVISFPSHKLKR
jgi:hypothetical protein